MTKMTQIFGNGFRSIFNAPQNDHMVSLFRTEYGKDYHWAVKNGVSVNSQFVKEFLANQKL